MIAAGRLGGPRETRYFPAAIYPVDGRPLRRGDPSAAVTIEVADDTAEEFLDAGQHFAARNGAEPGRGVISRRVFFTPVG
jgi:hypothetical protein